MNIVRFLVPKSAVEYVNVGSTVRQALEKMRYHHYVAIPVLDDEGKYVATLRTDDIFKYFLANGRFDYKTAERDGLSAIIDREYSKPLYHDAPLEDMIEYVKEHNFVPVVDDRGCFMGIILRRDVLAFLFNHYKKTKED
ncbi:MAG: CBS domain-containing protein [Clostridia bacterium]|nr:CBS domain-containing protein [Clostridia bacterium]